MFLFILLFARVPIWAQESSVQNSVNYSTENGLVSNDVLSVIFVERTNSVWFGTDQGVSRFDGTWHSYSSKSDDDGVAAFPPGRVRVLEYSEEQDSLWAATSFGYVARWNPADDIWETLIEPADVDGLGVIHALFVDDAAVWIGTDSGLLKFDADTDTLMLSQLTCDDPVATRTADDEPIVIQTGDDETISVYAIVQNENKLWYGTNRGLFFQESEGCWKNETTLINEKNPSINSLLWVDETFGNEQNWVLWIGTEGAVARFDPDAASNERWIIFDIVKSDGVEMVPVAITNLVAGMAGDLWVATDGDGARNISSNGTTIGYNSSVAKRRLNNSVLGVALDSDGAIWFATPIGVTKYLRKNLWTTNTFSEDRLNGHPSTASSEPPESSYWNDFEFDALKANINKIWDMLVSKTDNQVWIASSGGIRVRLVDVEREELYIGNGTLESESENSAFKNATLPQNLTTALTQDSRGAIWAGFDQLGVATYQADKWVTPTWVGELPSTAINDLIAVDNVLWIGTATSDPAISALVSVDITQPLSGTVNVVDEFAEDGSVMSMALDTQERLWVSTAGSNVKVHMLQADGTWVSTPLTETTQSDMLPNGFISLEADPTIAGGVLLAAPGIGLYRWDNVEWSNADPENKLPTKDVRTLFSDMQTGDLWIGTAAGVTRYDGHTWETFSSDDGLVSGGIDVITRTPNGAYWFGGDGDGYAVYDPTDVTPPWIRVGPIERSSDLRFLTEGGDVADATAYRDGLTIQMNEGSGLRLFLEYGDLQTPSEQLQVYYRRVATTADSVTTTDCMVGEQWQDYNGPFTWDAGEVGEHLIEFCARDQSFKYSSVQSLPLIVQPSNTWDLSALGIPNPVDRRIALALLGLSAIAVLAFGYVGFDRTRQRRRSIDALQRGYNPYVSGEPIRSEDMFFGRQGMLQRIIDTLHNNSIMIHGERRIGKTTMLYQLSNTLEDVADPEFWFVPIYIDLEGTSEEMFFHLLVEEIVHKTLTLEDADTLLTPAFDQLSYHDIPGEAYTDRRFTRDLRTIIQALQEFGETKYPSRQLRVILLMDEMDVLSQYDHLIQQQLRRIFMRDFAATLGAVVAGIQISREWDRVESPWFNLFNEIEIEPFGREEGIELLVEPVKGYYNYDSAALEMILEYSDGRPFRIQQYALEAVTHMLADGRRQIRTVDVEVAHENIQTSGNLSHIDAGLSQTGSSTAGLSTESNNTENNNTDTG